MQSVIASMSRGDHGWLAQPCRLVLAAVFLSATAICAAASTADDKIVARIDDRPIYLSQVERVRERATGEQELSGEALKVARAAALQQLVQRQVVLSYLLRKKVAATKDEIDLEIERLRKRLDAKNLTLDKYYDNSGLDEQQLRARLRWRISWTRYLERLLTDDNLQRFFERHHRHFDGSELKVAQILLKGDDALERAKRLREKIKSRQLAFSTAAQRYSKAPSGKEGGEIGFIRRDGPMPEAFSKAAFELEKDEISRPIKTTFGVHLIKLLDIKPGKLAWQDVRPQLEQATAAYLFDYLADRERKNARVEFTGAMPHFRPGTREIVK